MSAILPLASLGLLGFYLRKHLFFPPRSLRETFIAAFILWSATCVFITEFLSLFSKIDYLSMALFWAFIFCILLVLCLRKAANTTNLTAHFKERFIPLERSIICSIIFISFCTLIIALIAPPNTWDSLTYHMSRVEHWIQNRTLAHYPTSDGRQIYNPPLAEIIIMNFQVLTRSDYFANLLQWLSMAGCLLGVSLIAKEYGANRLGQLLAAFFMATLSAGILQSTGTQNDYVASFFIVAFVYFLMRNPDSNKLDSILTGLALGLAWLTKATCYIYSLPFILFYVYQALEGKNISKLKNIFFIILIALAINSGHYKRNYLTAGNILGSEGHISSHSTQSKSPNLIAANIMCNISMHLGTSSGKINTVIEHFIYSLGNILGVDLANPDPRNFNEPFHVQAFIHEDLAGNFSHMILILGCFIYAFLFRKKYSFQPVLGYFFTVLFAAVLFSISVKCFLSNTRLHLPLFALCAPFAGVVLEKAGKNRFVLAFVLIWLFVSAMPFVFRNNSRRLISSKSTVFSKPRIEQYFNNDSTLYGPYLEAAKEIKALGCKNLGLVIQSNSWEYPLWVLLRYLEVDPIRFEHVEAYGYDKISVKKYPLGDFTPELVLSVNSDCAETLKLKAGAREIKRFWQSGSLALYK
ncbi:MAG: glycosyltransferase family 39 protein [Candidatus Omnitrophica bacterium]|nr:glycosyltransferase family 39 protein [Candidatus Omnitrophota bacterium]